MINYLLSDIKQGKESYASSVACVAGSPVTGRGKEEETSYKEDDKVANKDKP